MKELYIYIDKEVEYLKETIQSLDIIEDKQRIEFIQQRITVLERVMKYSYALRTILPCTTKRCNCTFVKLQIGTTLSEALKMSNMNRGEYAQYFDLIEQLNPTAKPCPIAKRSNVISVIAVSVQDLPV